MTTTTIWNQAFYNSGEQLVLKVAVHDADHTSAMCEKQIVVPNSSILYCSERYFPRSPYLFILLIWYFSCRRRDSAIPIANPYLSLLSSPTKMVTSTLVGDMDDPFGSKIPTYVPQLQPTPRTAPDGRIPAKFHDTKSGLDPTEWKPAELSVTEWKSPTKSGDWKPKLTHRPSSEATSYLSKFHRSSDSLTSRRRPMIGHSRTTISSRSTPGLSLTSTASTSSEESLAGTPYEFVARPALSMPATSVSNPTLASKDGNDLTYEKKHIGTSMGSATGSLKKLLGTTAGVM